MKKGDIEKDNIGLTEACNLLNRSRKTLGKYIKAGKLKPERILSRKGTLEYRFRKADLDSFVISGTGKIEKTRREETGKEKEVISLLKDTMQVLKKQLMIKDKIINNLLERSRENNILLGSLQNKVLMLEDKTKGENRGEREEEKRWGKGSLNGFFKRLFKG